MMNNVFANSARTVANMTVTENGHPAASTTGSALLDLYGQVGALRGQDKDRICKLLDAAMKEDQLLATKIMFYARDCRGGTGEREVFRTMVKHAAQKYPDILINNLELFPEYGRWDDLYALVDTPLEDEVFETIRLQFMKDDVALHEGRPVSLLAKWLKSCNASSKETKVLGYLTRKHLDLSEKEYRKILKQLRDAIRIVESKMSSNEWNRIDYDKIPSRAGMIYREAFRRHDEERYKAYIDAVRKGEKKINVAMNTPQDLVHCYSDGLGSVRKPEDPTIEAMWKNLPGYIQSDENVLCMVDVSGSMYGRPIEVSTGLGMYFAQKNTGAFHNLFMTFESQPRFAVLSDAKSFHDNLRDVFNAPWGGSTDLNRACEAILNFAVRNNVPQKDMPTRLIIISDMEIDAATRCYYREIDPRYGFIVHRSKVRDLTDILHIDELKQMYARHGYQVPQVIYWNVESRDNHFHTRSDVPGTMLASGSSPRVFEAVMQMKDLDITPYDAMLEVLNGERYAAVK